MIKKNFFIVLLYTGRVWLVVVPLTTATLNRYHFLADPNSYISILIYGHMQDIG